MAQCRRPLRSSPPVLRYEGNELLHRLVRRLKSPGSHCFPRLGQSSRTSAGETEIYVNCRTQEIGRSLNWRKQQKNLKAHIRTFILILVMFTALQYYANAVLILYQKLTTSVSGF